MQIHADPDPQHRPEGKIFIHIDVLAIFKLNVEQPVVGKNQSLMCKAMKKKIKALPVK